MKNLGILLLFLSPLCGLAQTDSTKYRQKEEFCVASIPSNGNKYELYVNDGTKTPGKEKYLKDSQHKTVQFDSIVSVLNYMEQQGWVIAASASGTANGFMLTVVTFVYERPLKK